MKRKHSYGNSSKIDGWRTVTISYRRVDIPLATNRVGYGKTYDEAIEDADRQLPEGEWRRVVISHPGTVLSDVSMTKASRTSRMRLLRGEGEIIKVEKLITRGGKN